MVLNTAVKLSRSPLVFNSLWRRVKTALRRARRAVLTHARTAPQYEGWQGLGAPSCYSWPGAC